MEKSGILNGGRPGVICPVMLSSSIPFSSSTEARIAAPMTMIQFAPGSRGV